MREEEKKVGKMAGIEEKQVGEKQVEKKEEQPKSVSIKFGLFPKIQELSEEILLPKDKIIK